jgi:uncharacterized phage infection (PIP) family protein YhgE
MNYSNKDNIYVNLPIQARPIPQVYNNNITNTNNKPNVGPITRVTPITHVTPIIHTIPVSKEHFDASINKLDEKFDTILNTMDQRYTADIQAIENRYLEAIRAFQSQHSIDLQNLNTSFTNLHNQYNDLLEQHNTLIDQLDSVLSILQPVVIVPSSYIIPTTGPTLVTRDDIDDSFTPDLLKQPIATLSKNISTYTKDYNVHDHPVKMANLEIMKQNYDLLRTIRDERKAIIDGRIKDKIKPRG